MKRGNSDIDRIVDAHLGLFGSPPVHEIAAAEERTLLRLREERRDGCKMPVAQSNSSSVAWTWGLAIAGGLAAAILVVVLRLPVVHDSDVPPDFQAVVESADGGLHMSSGEIMPSGTRVATGQLIRTNGGTGAQLTLLDGSLLEMRSQSELSLERSQDGLRIRLNRGGIIVSAAEQRGGRLYVQTKDVTVSVVGTVFFVNAGEAGSRVAVIEGEVYVQGGATQQTLLPGEQVATNPLLPPSPVREAIAWSRNAPALVALLRPADVVAPAFTAQSQNQSPAAAAPHDAFEVASIRPTRFAPGTGARGAGGGGRTSPRPEGEPCGHSGTSFLQFDPRRAAITNMTLYGLITWAYDLPCRPWNGSHVLVGGPGWVRNDGYDIEALLPDGAPSYTAETITQMDFLGRGERRTFTRTSMTPRFRTLLQTLLAERFGLVLRRETRDVPVYALMVAPGGPKLTAWKEGDPTSIEEFMAQRARNGTLLAEEQLSVIGMTAAEVNDLFTKNPMEVEALVFRTYREKGIRQLYTLANVNASMASLTEIVDRTFDNENWRPVIDRTGITTPFNYLVRYDRSPAPDAVGPTIFAALERELGLRLTPSTAPMEVLVIERAERPTEN